MSDVQGHASLAIAAAKRAARAGIAPFGDDAEDAHALSALIHTVSEEARTMNVSTKARIDAHTRALALAVVKVAPTQADAGRALLRAALQLATAELETLYALPNVVNALTKEKP